MKYIKLFESIKDYVSLSDDQTKDYLYRDLYIKFTKDDIESIRIEFNKMGYTYHEGGPYYSRKIFIDSRRVVKKGGKTFEVYDTNDWCINEKNTNDCINYVGKDINGNNVRMWVHKIYDEYFIVAITSVITFVDYTNSYKCDQLHGLLQCLKDNNIIK